jgi:hypothetical protein
MKTVTPVSIALVAVFVADLPPTSPLPDQAGQSRGLSHLDIHLAKEDAHLYRLIRERVSLPDPGKAVGVMASTVPQERFPEVVAWLFPLIGHGDRANMTRVWQMLMPPEAFAGVKKLVQKAVGDDWGELTQRIPELSL